MYCQFCGTPRAQGLSYCNRCGADLRERIQSGHNVAITGILTAITLLGLIGLGIMIGGSLTLRREAGLSQDLIGVFMLFVFLVVSVTEIMLVRNLSKLIASATGKQETHAARAADTTRDAVASGGQPWRTGAERCREHDAHT
jgi:hypothetical protein